MFESTLDILTDILHYLIDVALVKLQIAVLVDSLINTVVFVDGICSY